MADLILREIENLKQEVPRLSSLSQEYIFSLICYKYFYNNGELSYKDYVEIFVDGKSDGGIDLACVSEDPNDQQNLVLIQSKNIDNLANSTDIIDIFTKMHRTLKDFQENKTAKYSKRLKQKLRDKLSDIENVKSGISLVLFINTDLTAERKRNIEEMIDNEDCLSAYQINFYDKAEIISHIESILSPKRFVDEAVIRISKQDGKISYGDNGIMVNIKASSLKEMYDRFRDKGLFEQNYRYYIKNKKIDDNIKNSLNNKRNSFWFLNNGIIIGCNDFFYDNEKITLYKFSIINGCQTATLIGEYRGKNENEEFVLPCKIVKPKEKSSDDEFMRFVSEIAESSNSQKPISDRDLKANSPEQRLLQQKLKEDDPKIYLEIKRGEEKKKHTETWQCLTNDVYGQLVLSFNFQQPGTARSLKKRIFGDEFVYNKIFKRRIDKDNIVDLLKLDYLYQQYLKKNLTSSTFADYDIESVATNGRLAIIALIGFLIKIKRNEVNIKILSDPDNGPLELQRDSIKGKFFDPDYKDDYSPLLEALFIEIIQELTDKYGKDEEKYKTVSNYFKSDKYYHDIIAYIITRYVNNPIKKKEIDNYLKIFK